jgi:hypothetical protein
MAEENATSNSYCLHSSGINIMPSFMAKMLATATVSVLTRLALSTLGNATQIGAIELVKKMQHRIHLSVFSFGQVLWQKCLRQQLEVYLIDLPCLPWAMHHKQSNLNGRRKCNIAFILSSFQRH